MLSQSIHFVLFLILLTFISYCVDLAILDWCLCHSVVVDELRNFPVIVVKMLSFFFLFIIVSFFSSISWDFNHGKVKLIITYSSWDTKRTSVWLKYGFHFVVTAYFLFTGVSFLPGIHSFRHFLLDFARGGESCRYMMLCKLSYRNKLMRNDLCWVFIFHIQSSKYIRYWVLYSILWLSSKLPFFLDCQYRETAFEAHGKSIEIFQFFLMGTRTNAWLRQFPS